MLSLIQIKSKLVGFLQSHKQLKQVIWGDEFDFAAERNLSYPVANIEWLSNNIAQSNMTYNFKVTLGDLINDEVERIEDEIYSDMILVADDFMSWLQEQEGFSFNKSVAINKFIDSYGDRVAGITFSINLAVIRRQNECVTPIKNIIK